MRGEGYTVKLTRKATRRNENHSSTTTGAHILVRNVVKGSISGCGTQHRRIVLSMRGHFGIVCGVRRVETGVLTRRRCPAGLFAWEGG